VEAPGFWGVYRSADRQVVEDFLKRLAGKLGIPQPPIVEDQVALPADQGRVVAAMDEIEPEWRSKAWIYPPPGSPHT
jgi:hypothetical protein